MLTLIALCALTLTDQFTTRFDNSCVLRDGFTVSYVMDFDPICDHDPGPPPTYTEDHNYPYTIQYNCWLALDDTQAAAAYWECFLQHEKVYQELVEISARLYRQTVCSCWTEFPNNPAMRDICIENALHDYNMATQSDKSFLEVQQANCCPANP